MKILIAPNSMKGSLNAFDFADKIEIRKIRGVDHINGKGESFLKIRMAEEDKYDYQVGSTFMYQPEFEKAFRDNAETYDTNHFKA